MSDVVSVAALIKLHNVRLPMEDDGVPVVLFDCLSAHKVTQTQPHDSLAVLQLVIMVGPEVGALSANPFTCKIKQII